MYTDSDLGRVRETFRAVILSVVVAAVRVGGFEARANPCVGNCLWLGNSRYRVPLVPLEDSLVWSESLATVEGCVRDAC